MKRMLHKGSQNICIIPDVDPTVEFIELGEEYQLVRLLFMYFVI